MEKIYIKSSESEPFSAWRALPATGRGPAIILLQEIFGVNSHIRKLAELYAACGYVVVAPDLFWRLKPELELGYGEDDVTVALDLYARLDVEAAVHDIGAVVDMLSGDPACTGRIGVIGFCLGGYLAYRSAIRHNIDAAVCYYGVGVERHLDATTPPRCPVMLHYAGADQFIPAATVAEIAAFFIAKGGVEVFTYPGVDHAFLNNERSAFDAGAAMLSQARTSRFLHLALHSAVAQV